MTLGMWAEVIHPEDTKTIKAALALARDVFWDFEAMLETEPEGVAIFDEGLEYAHVAQEMASGRFLMWGCWLEDELIGMLAVRPPSEVSHLYVARAHHRQGAARQMMTRALTFFGKMGCEEVTIHASAYAVPALNRMGFVTAAAPCVQDGLRGVPMKFRLV